MNKDELIIDFVKSLRIVLNNAAAYPKDHPYFLKSAETFKQKADQLLLVLKPIRINVAPDFMIVEEVKLSRESFFIELAQMLHLRKIKSIQINPGARLGELVEFLSAIAMPSGELLRAGGTGAILKKANCSNVFVQEVDYSGLLGTQGKEAKDVWAHLFRDAVLAQDSCKIDEYADDFERIVRSFKPQQLSSDPQLKEGLRGFLVYLKEHQKEKFHKCSNELFSFALGSKDISETEIHGGIKELFQDFSEEDLAGLLWEGVSSDGNFDALSLKLFSRLTEKSRQEDIASSFLDKAKAKSAAQDSLKLAKKIQELLSLSEDKLIPEVYRGTLSTLLKDLSQTKTGSFDRGQLNINYHYILLNLLETASLEEDAELVAKKSSLGMAEMVEGRDFEYLRLLLELLIRKEGLHCLGRDVFLEVEKKIGAFIEKMIWEQRPAEELSFFIEHLSQSTLTTETYLDNIFRQGNFNPYVLRMFFKFFPQSFPAFLRILESKYSDMDFLSRLIASLSAVDSPASLEALKHIVSFANEFIKIEAVRAMRSITKPEPEYLLGLLDSQSVPLRKEALLLLMRDQQYGDAAAERLLNIPSPWGAKNSLILENILVVHEARALCARRHLERLAKRHFLWNMKVRGLARRILKEWDVS